MRIFGACRVAKRTARQKFSEQGETWQKTKVRGTIRGQIIQDFTGHSNKFGFCIKHEKNFEQ